MINGRRLLGVLDCADPPAAAAFMERLNAASRRRSGGPTPAILWSDPVPVEPDASPIAPAPALLGLHALERAGADAVAIPGAGAHIWYRDLCAAAHVPVMHIVECAAADLRRARPPGSPIAVLSAGNETTTDLYRARLRQLGFAVMEIPATITDRMADAAQRIRRGDLAGADQAVRACITALGRDGAAAVVVACGDWSCAPHRPWTEDEPAREPGRPALLVIDPLESLAHTAASWARGGCDAWDLVVDIPEPTPEPAAGPPG